MTQSNKSISPLRQLSGPEAVLAYLSRYTHRVAIANSRLIACDEHHVTFKWKDYRAKSNKRYKTMQLAIDEFIRRFLIHVMPAGLHRIRHFGLFANPVRTAHLQHIRQLLGARKRDENESVARDVEVSTPCVCPACGAPMIIIEVLVRSHSPRAPPS